MKDKKSIKSQNSTSDRKRPKRKLETKKKGGKRPRKLLQENQIVESTSSQSDEEKQRKREIKKQLLEKAKQKKIAKREKVRAKTNLLLKASLAREVEYGRINFRKYQESWGKMLLNIILPRQKEELICAWTNFELAVDVKNYEISFLTEEARKAEDQLIMSSNLQHAAIKSMISHFERQTNDLHSNFLMSIKELKKREGKIINTFNKKNADNVNYMNSITLTMKKFKRKRDAEFKARIFSIEEATSLKNDIIILRHRVKMETLIESIWKNTNNVIAKYKESNRKLQSEIKLITDESDKRQQIVSEESKLRHRLEANAKVLIKKAQNLESYKLQNLESEWRFFRINFLKRKAKLEEDLKLDAKKIKYLAYGFHEVDMKLKGIIKTGESVIKMARCCRPMETLKEKTDARYKSDIPSATMEEKLICNLYQKIAVADSSRTELAEEKAFLSMQNKLIQNKIKKMCLCSPCAYAPPIIKREGRIPVIEAHIVMKNVAMHGPIAKKYF